jgi:hypothetical protein
MVFPSSMSFPSRPRSPAPTTSRSRCRKLFAGSSRYAWPGYDTRPIPGREPSTSYGFLPSSLLQRVLDTMVAVGIGRPVDRD